MSVVYITENLKRAEEFILSFLKYFKGNFTAPIALKTHFGEEGNTTHIPPYYIKYVIDYLKSIGLKSTLIETTTLYKGKRATRKGHLMIARGHGFMDIGAEVRIIDGEYGEDSIVFNGLKYASEVVIGKGLDNFKTLIVLSHVKGHSVAGFGGAIKNVSMGLSAKKGKLIMHSTTHPYVNEKKCIACEECVVFCPVQSISIINEHAVISDTCIGCGGCVAVCPENAIKIKWDQDIKKMMYSMVEYTSVVKDMFDSNILYVNFLINITPECDCFPSNGKFINKDVGILASRDPVSLDKASFDLIKDAILKAHQINPEPMFNYAEEIGLGENTYQLEVL